MSIMELGALGEFLSSIVVVGTLIYLAAQIRQTTNGLAQNRDIMRGQTRHQLAKGVIDLQIATATNQQLVELLDRADRGEELTDAEQKQIGYRFNALLRHWENSHYQYRQDLYDEAEFAKQREAWRWSLEKGPAMTAYWYKMRPLYSPEFVAELDSLLPKHN